MDIAYRDWFVKIITVGNRGSQIHLFVNCVGILTFIYIIEWSHFDSTSNFFGSLNKIIEILEVTITA